MKFSEAYQIMLKGGKIKRASWTGFWYINSVTGELIIRKGNGEELKNSSDNLKLTVENTLAEDWQEWQMAQSCGRVLCYWQNDEKEV